MISDSKQYSWRPFFREVAEKLCEIGEDTQHRDERIIEAARTIFKKDDGSGHSIVRKGYLDKGGVDPFSVIYALSACYRRCLDPAVKVLEMSSKATDITDFDFPHVAGSSNRFFHNAGSYVLDKNGHVDHQPTREATADNLNQLWQLFRDVYNAKTYSAIDDERFQKTLSRPGFGLAKFTQVMFLINSDAFLPIDDRTLYLPLFSTGSSKEMGELIDDGTEKFSAIMKKITDTFGGCKPFEINLFARLIAEHRLTLNDTIWNINAFIDDDGNDDYPIFKKESKAFTAGFAPGNDESRSLYHVTEPQKGDCILARQSKTFKMLGVVLRNRYADKGKWFGHKQGGYIEVVWIQRQDKPRNSSQGKALCEHHQGISFYPEIEKLIDSIKEKQGEITEMENSMENKYPEHIALLKANQNLILTGAPGTGKTYLAKQLVRYLLKTEDLSHSKNYSFVQFHPAYDYTDFVEGLRPVPSEKDSNNSNIRFKRKDGLFKAFCKHAAEHKEPHVCIIDEINRGEISKIFGELFFSIDPGYRGEEGRVTTQYANMLDDEKDGDDIFKDGFYVPKNVYIIGTMNDIDRSVESFDFAMRRRFAWKEIGYKDTLNMLDKLGKPNFVAKAKARIKNLNKAISNIVGLGDAYHIGGAYFKKIESYKNMADKDKWDTLWNNHLQPLLGEYLRTLPKKAENLGDLKKAYDNEKEEDGQSQED